MHTSTANPSAPPPTPQEILERQRAKLAVAPGGPLPDEMVCPRCGKNEALRPESNPRFCAKANGGCGAPAKGDGFTLITRAEWESYRRV